MASNNEKIAKAVEQVITSDDSIDLLLISQTLDDINGEVVGGTTDYGMHYNMLYIGMSGQKFVDQMNSNWEATDSQFLSNQRELEIRIVSNQIKEIKEDNGVLYYTTDSEEVENKTWIPIESGWGKIVGNIADQQDLQEALAEKASQADFVQLSNIVSTNSDNIILIRGDLTQLTNTVANLVQQMSGTNGVLVRLDTIEDLLARKINSTTVLEIRTVNESALEFTSDGVNWHPVASAGLVEWGDIIGDIENQADIQLLFNNINERITEHEGNIDNPHEVTASQVGLGNVDNTSDIDKPVSIQQRQAIDESKQEAVAEAVAEAVPQAVEQASQIMDEKIADIDIKFKLMTKAEYEALANKDGNTLYFISDL